MPAQMASIAQRTAAKDDTMAITEQTRHELLTACEHTLGKEAAMTLAELLPPVGWADVATKHDLAQLEQRLDLRFDAIDLRFAAMDASIDQRFDAMDSSIDLRLEVLEHKVIGAIRKDIADSQRTLVFGMVSAIAANTALVLTASRLFT